MPAAPDRFASVCRRGALAALAVLFLAGAAAPARDESRIVVDQALSAAEVDGRVPQLTEGRLTALPDDWASSRPGYSGIVWYRTSFELPSAAPSDELTSLFIGRACTNVQIHLNGTLVFSGGRMSEPVARLCQRPLLVTLPSALLRTGSNALVLRVQGHAQERVGSVQSAAGLSRLEVGLESTLRREHASLYFWRVSWPSAAGLILIGIGCVLLAVGWINRHEVYYAYLGWLSLAWVLFTLAASASQLPWDNAVHEFLLVSAWPVLLALTAQFALSYAGVRSRAIEMLAALQWVLVPATLMIDGQRNLFVLANVWYVLLGLELVAVLALVLWLLHRERRGDFVAVLVLVAGGAAALVGELAVQWGLLPLPPVSPGSVFVPVALSLVGARLFAIFGRALRTMRSDRDRIAGELQRVSAEIDDRVERLTAERVGEFTELERRRIAADLHDDLGAKLLTIVHGSDPSRTAELAREALDEMRLSVRGLAGKAVRLDDAMADWRAETVARLEQAGVEPHWDSEPPAQPPTLSARTFMQLTRILREAVSNVIKHSGAARCDVACTLEDGSLRLVVRDNGEGIVREFDRGSGMAGMKRRAKRLSGQCLVESYPGRGVVILLTVPL